MYRSERHIVELVSQDTCLRELVVNTRIATTKYQRYTNLGGFGPQSLELHRCTVIHASNCTEVNDQENYCILLQMLSGGFSDSGLHSSKEEISLETYQADGPSNARNHSGTLCTPDRMRCNQACIN